MQNCKTLFYIAFLIICVKINAQEFPPIEIYTPKQYNAENQNWAISQSSEKYIYVANNKGLLEYNGAKWQLYNSPNETIIRSVNVVGNKIYTGCYMEFGYWEKDDFGMLSYTSLSDKIDDLVEDEQFWNIIHLNQWVLFESFNRIYIYDTITDSFKIINSDINITKMFKVGEDIYFQKANNGIYKILNGESILVTNNELLKDVLIINIFKENDELLFLTNKRGFLRFKENVLSEWEYDAEQKLKDVVIYSGIQLKNGSFLLGTISNGIIYLSSNGEFNYQINQTSGLGNNTVLSIFEDIDNNIWLGLDNGINCINMNSPFRIYNDDKGYLGTIYQSVIFNDTLYLGTNQGLFYKRNNSNDKFTFIENTKGQVWSLVEINDQLFCGHNSGTFLVKGNKAELIVNIEGTWDIKTIEKQPNLLLQGNYNGLNIIENHNGIWKFRNKIEGFDNSSRFFDFLKPNEILVNHEYKGIFKIEVNDEYSKAIKVTKDNSIKKGLNSSLIKYNDAIYYASKDGVFKKAGINSNFTKDTLLSNIIETQGYTSGKLVHDKKTNRLWSISNKGLNYITPGQLSSTPKINSIAFPIDLRKGVSGYENIYNIDNNKYLFGTSAGYVNIDISKITDKDYEIAINSITNTALNDSTIRVDKLLEGDFKNNQNNLEFTYSVPEYNKFLEVEYSHKLENIYENWSEWNGNSSILYKNLPFGDYTFMVKAKVGGEVVGNVATYSFTIEKPWYLSKLMIAIYILSVLFFSIFMHHFYKRYYKKQREKLLLKTQRELELKDLENKQHIMALNNEKLKQDIDNKNRELAISTMSLIKKNEFLNNIKKELNNSKKDNNVNAVVKIIDKNINNKDDWKLFEEAFNNADKDFLKRIKTKHPLLTSNDLRLCAYLRLNLSSKEIAPLLNISPRSVEVKRYRLRKKMDLPHKVSLTDYILET